MNTYKHKVYRVVCFFVVYLTVVFGIAVNESQAQMRLGVAIPESEPVVRLESVINHPADYDGKNIVMKGVVAGQCAALCEFFFRDGVHSATIYPQGFKFPRLQRGSTVTIYAQVISGWGQVVFSALGVQMD